MSQIGNFNGHVFEVSDRLIRGFTELSINGGCETTEKNTNEQKYVERKYGNAQTITLVVGLNALLGVTDVYGEAMQLVAEAEAGATGYFYLGGRKLVSCQLMLTRADVVEVETMAGRGDVWIKCNVRITLQQASDNDGSIPASSGGGSGSGGSGSGGSGNGKTEAETSTGKWPPDNKEIATFAATTALNTALGVVTGNPAVLAPAITQGAKIAMNFISNAMEKAKSNSATAKGDQPAMKRLSEVSKIKNTTMKNSTSAGKYDTAEGVLQGVADARSASDSSQKTNATTGRGQGGGKVDAITMAAPSMNAVADKVTNAIVDWLHH